MIKTLRFRFVLLAMTALFTLLAVIVAAMNLVNYRSITHEADVILEILTDNKGSFPDYANDRNRPLPKNMSPETPYESRYFTVILDDNGSFLGAETAKVASVNSAAASLYADAAIRSGETRGFVGKYRYAFFNDKMGPRILFLDWGRNLDAFYNFLYTSIAMTLFGLIGIFPVIYSMAGRILKPVSESYEKQRVFITDAGHEIKTPLTIISANTDLLEMELGENESLSDIRTQTDRLKTLTNDLVMLSRMEEADRPVRRIEFPLSEVVSETALSFRAPAARENKTLTLAVTPLLTLEGDSASIQKLTGLLLDNAIKYSPKDSEITVSLERQKNLIRLTVKNKITEEISKEQLPRIFDRFYRTDASRNSETGGHGIGLSIASLIVKNHGGKIQAKTDPDGFFLISAAFPAA